MNLWENIWEDIFVFKMQHAAFYIFRFLFFLCFLFFHPPCFSSCFFMRHSSKFVFLTISSDSSIHLKSVDCVCFLFSFKTFPTSNKWIHKSAARQVWHLRKRELQHHTNCVMNCSIKVIKVIVLKNLAFSHKEPAVNCDNGLGGHACCKNRLNSSQGSFTER